MIMRIDFYRISVIMNLMTPFYIILGIIALVVIGFIAIYNGLVRKRNRADEAWSDIEVQMKRRYDLIPNVLETVKGYAAHERGALEGVTAARTAAMSARGPDTKLKAENALSGTLKSLFAVAENYPDLKANANFLDLQRELSDTENKIQASRRFYNGTVMDYNTALQSFPSNLVSGLFGFVKKELFGLDSADSAARNPVAVKF